MTMEQKHEATSGLASAIAFTGITETMRYLVRLGGVI
jgi:hypothetical protein